MLYFITEPILCLWFLQIASFSMLPLFVLDELILPFILLTVIYLILIRIVVCLSTKPKHTLSPTWDLLSFCYINDNKLIICLFYLSTFVGCSLLLLCQLVVKPPKSLPFLIPLLISTYCCLHFVGFFIYFNYRQLLSTGFFTSVTSTKKTRSNPKAKKLFDSKKKL